jgi:membrane-associated phospholipid phosphatase
VRRKERHFSSTTPLVKTYSALGEHGALWLGLAAAGRAVHPSPRWGRSAAAVVVAYWAAVGIKNVIRRRRPALAEYPALITTPGGLSFPSAHAAAAMAAAAKLDAHYPRPPLYAAVLAMCATRPYLGVHYPSDIVAGALLGAAIGRALR